MDGRKNNGGHSTKSTGKDKRKNEYKKALDKASTVEDVVSVICMVRDKAIEKKDIQAAKVFLEYYLGKPKETININPDNDFHIPLTTFFSTNDEN